MRLLKKENKNLYAEVTSAHLGLNTQDPIGMLAKMIPPIREKKDSDALWRGVREDVVDTFGTDNVTRTIADKRLDQGMWGSRTGYAVLGTHLPVLISEGYHKARRAAARYRPEGHDVAPPKFSGSIRARGPSESARTPTLSSWIWTRSSRSIPRGSGPAAIFPSSRGKPSRGGP